MARVTPLSVRLAYAKACGYEPTAPEDRNACVQLCEYVEARFPLAPVRTTKRARVARNAFALADRIAIGTLCTMAGAIVSLFVLAGAH